MDTSSTHEPTLHDSLELRVLHGPQAGSTLPMEQGHTYTLGTADSCAVLLAGTQVEAEHVALAVDTDGIQVTLLQGRVMTLDRSEVVSGEMVALGTVLRLGRVKLTVERVGAPWPHDEALEEPDPPPPPVQAEPEESIEPVAQEAAAEPPAPPAALRPTRLRRLLPSLVFGGLATLLMGAAVAAWVTSDDSQQAAAEAARQAAAAAAAPATVPLLDVAELSRQFPGATLKATRDANGKWVLSGRVSSEDARRKLREAAAGLSAAPDVRVMVDDERLSAVTQFIEKRRVAGEVELAVEPRGSGVLRITGAVASQSQLTALTEAAKTELAEAGPVEFAVLLRSDLAMRFEERLRSAGLAPKFRVMRREPQMQLQAVLTANEVRHWEKLFLEFTREFGSVLTITANVQQERDTVEAHIETVVAGAFPYVVTTGGRRIAPGGTLEGRTLTAVRDGELIFSDGLRVRYGN